MTDADVCAQMLMGEPMVNLAALTELRSFLDSWLRDQGNTADPTTGDVRPDSGSRSPNDRGKTESGWEAPE
jgi:hypothetical protein